MHTSGDVVLSRYRPLGMFRFGLALLVTAQHFQHLLPPAERAVFSRMGFGAIAVAVFFAVSGFVVAEANALFYRGRPGAFLANRLLRLVPPYLAALLLSAVLQAALWHAGRLALWDYPNAGAPITAAHLLGGVLGLVPGLQMLLPSAAGFEFIPFAWSLRMEMAFYAAVTLTLLLASPPMARSTRMHQPRAIITAALIAALLASAAFLTLGRPGLLSTAPMFLLGVTFWLAMRRPRAARCALLAVTLGIAAVGFRSWVQHGHPVLLAQGVLLGALLLAGAALATRRIQPRWHRIDRGLGDVSYPLYLNHYVVGLTLSGLWPEGSVGLYAGGIALSVLVAATLGTAVDRQLTKARDGLRRARL